MLCKIDLTQKWNGSSTTVVTQTVRIGTSECFTPDGAFWQAALKDSFAIRAPGGEIEPGPDLCSTDFMISKRRLAFQEAGRDATNLPRDCQLYGATVTLYLWEPSCTSINDLSQQLSGTINRFK